MEVVAYLQRLRSSGRILHVGVGNSVLRTTLGETVVQGLTRDGAEVVRAAELGLSVVLCNKYDVGSYREKLTAPFDCIVDVNIRSYACCDRHFQEYMAEMAKCLSDRGALLTGKRGLAYLVPTSLQDLKQFCPDWSVRVDGNVVIMRPRKEGWIRGSLTRAMEAFRSSS
jgi:hypothetical protein